MLVRNPSVFGPRGAVRHLDLLLRHVHRAHPGALDDVRGLGLPREVGAVHLEVLDLVVLDVFEEPTVGDGHHVRAGRLVLVVVEQIGGEEEEEGVHAHREQTHGLEETPEPRREVRRAPDDLFVQILFVLVGIRLAELARRGTARWCLRAHIDRGRLGGLILQLALRIVLGARG